MTVSTDVILFNIDSKSEMTGKQSKDAIVSVFLRVFNEMQGFCGTNPYLADLERKLSEGGQYEAFRQRIEEKVGQPWEEVRHDFDFIQDDVVETLADIGFMSMEAARNWCEKAVGDYDISIEDFARMVKRYIDRKPKGHHVVFLVDEVGQYIGDDSRLMLNMQTITEDLGKICRGKVYESEILFDVVTDIASYNYEKRSSEGVIVPVGEDDELQVAFIEPLEINEENTRALRKFLEMTREGLALAIKGNELVGLVLSKESDSSIVIMGTNSWKYCKQGIPVFSVSNGKVSVSSLVSDETMVFSDEQRKRLPCGETIVTIAQEATHQKHGTTIIFTNEAETEAQRLSQYHRCERIDPIDLSQHKEIIMPLTSIDGALIVSLRGWCYAVGAILDGEAVKPGSIGRGARYNSALNYVAWRKQKSTEGWYCAVIISEDGISNIVTTDDVDKIDNGQLDF